MFIFRLKEIVAAMQQKQSQAGERGGRAGRDGEEDEEEEERGKDRSRGDGGRRTGEKGARSRRATSEGGEGGEQSGRLRWRVHQLEKEKLELTSSHNQEVRNTSEHQELCQWFRAYFLRAQEGSQCTRV